MGLVFAVASDPARAGPPAHEPPAVAWIDATAPIIARIDPAAIEPATRFASRVSSRIAGLSGVARILAHTAVAVDPLTRAGLVAAGVDVSQPIWISVGAIDQAAAHARYDTIRAEAAVPDAPPVLWRARVAIAVGDPARADAMVRRIAALAPGLESVTAARTVAILASLGGDPQASATAIATLEAAGVMAVGQISGSRHTILVSRRGHVLLIDVLTPFGAGEIQWARDGDQVMARLASAASTHRPWRRWFGPTGDFAMYVDAARAADAAQMATAGAQLRRGIARGALSAGTLADLTTACAGTTAIAERGALAGLALQLSVTAAGEVRGAAQWPIRTPAIARVLGAPSRAATLPVVRGAVIAATAGVAPGRIASLWFPPKLASTRDAFWQAVDRCGAPAHALIMAIGWPEVAAGFAAEVGTIGDTARGLVAAIAGIAIAVRELSWSAGAMDGAVEIVARRAQAKTIRRLLDLVFGPSVRDPGGARRWTGGPLVPFEAMDRGRWAHFGAGFGAHAVDWFLGGARHRVAASRFAAASVDVDAAVRQLAGDFPAIAGWLDLVGRREGTAHIEAWVQTGAIRAAIRIRIE